MKKILWPQDQVYWYINRKRTNQLKENINVDVAVVGGGMAGLSAAQSFATRGYKVSLVERYFCGAGASGKSSGFITPDSEFELNQLVKLFGKDDALRLWKFALSGVDFINNNIHVNKINCEHKVEDTLIVANSDDAFKRTKKEHNIRKQSGFESTLFDKNNITKVIGSNNYAGGIYYAGSIGINPFHYCLGVKEVLEKSGVQIYEETPALEVSSNGVQTPYGFVSAEYIIVCVDRFLPELNKLKSEVFHAQTFLLMSEPLTQLDVKKIFPDKRLMVWDTDMIYKYFRLTSDNRLMIGGSSLLDIYWGKEEHNSNRMYNKLTTYFHTKFPEVKVDFKYYWPGLIGTSKDVLAIADKDAHSPNIYYVTCAAGLPWAAALGVYSADKFIDGRSDMDKLFSSKRKFPVNNAIQYILGKRISFAISNLITLRIKS